MRLLFAADVKFGCDLEVEIVIDVLRSDNISKEFIINRSSICTLILIIYYRCKVQHVIAYLSFCFVVSSWSDVCVGFKTFSCGNILRESENRTHYS